MPLGERFLFDVSFDEEDLALAEAEATAKLTVQDTELTDPEENIPTFTEDQLNAARHEGYQAGQEAGIQEAGDAIETKIDAVWTDVSIGVFLRSIIFYVRQLDAGAARRAWDPPWGLSKRIETPFSRVSARVSARRLVRRVYQTHADPGAAGLRRRAT